MESLSEHISIPVMKVSSSYIVTYSQYQGYRSSKNRHDLKQYNTADRTYNGYMSPNTKRQVTQYLTTWIDSVIRFRSYKTKIDHDKNIKLTFITLTLPSKQLHEDNFIKRNCLTPFIEKLKSQHDVKNYFWRAEAQENGNIHFHLIVDKKINWESIQVLWNQFMDKYGYIQNYRENQILFHKKGFKVRTELLKKWDYNHQLAAYIKGEENNWSNPNSTDIHSLKGIRNVASYITKYCCKEDGHRPIKGRIHGCSDEIKKLKYYSDELDYHNEKDLDRLVSTGKVKKIILDYATVFTGKIMSAIYEKCSGLYLKINNYLQNIYLTLYGNIPIPEPEIITTEKYQGESVVKKYFQPYICFE